MAVPQPRPIPGSPRRPRPGAARAPARPDFRTRWALRAKARADLYTQLAFYMSNGITIIVALREIQNNIEGREGPPRTRIGRAIARISEAITGQGFDFAMAMEHYAGPAEIMLLRTGDQDMAKALQRAARLLGTTQDAISRIVAGLGYPFVLINMALFSFYGFAIHVMPTFGALLPPDRWTGAAGALAATSMMVHDYLFLFYASVAAVAAAILLTMPVWTGATRARFDLFFPWSVYRTSQGATFLLSLSALLSSGMRLAPALEYLAAASQPWLRERLMATRRMIKGGDENLGTALREAGYNFPDPDLIRRLIVFSQFKDVDSQLESMANDWIASTKEKLTRAVSTAGGVAMFLVMMTLAFIGVGLMDVVQQFGAGGSVGGF